MEDFAGAYLARKNDISAFPKNQHHTIAIFHLGGIAIECRLKSLLLFYHQISEWGDKSCRDNDALFDNPIKRPGHNLINAIEQMPDLYSKAKLDRQFLVHLENIIRPLGSTNPDYINLRYIPQTNQTQEDWQKSFNYICGWLVKNEKSIL